MIEANFEFRIGDTYERNLTISKYNDDIDEMYLSVKKSDDDKKVILQKTLDNGITIVTDETIDGVRYRTYQIFIDANDTEDFKTGVEYPFDIEIVTDKDETKLKKTIVKGNLILNNATTRVWNEVV